MFPSLARQTVSMLIERKTLRNIGSQHVKIFISSISVKFQVIDLLYKLASVKYKENCGKIISRHVNIAILSSLWLLPLPCLPSSNVQRAKRCWSIIEHLRIFLGSLTIFGEYSEIWSSTRYRDIEFPQRENLLYFTEVHIIKSYILMLLAVSGFTLVMPDALYQINVTRS